MTNGSKRSGVRTGSWARRAGTAFVAWTMAITPALAEDVLIINGATGTSEPGTTSDITGNLSNRLTQAGNMVTVVDAFPNSLAGFDQVWDIRFSNNFVFSMPQSAELQNFVSGGGSLFVMGENSGFPSRNASVISLINQLGGGNLTFVVPSSAQTVQPAFRSPNNIDSVVYAAPGGVSGAGTGMCITQDGSGGCTAIFYPQGSLSEATAGDLTVVFDVNFMQALAGNNNAELLGNLIQILVDGVQDVAVVQQEDVIEKTNTAQVRVTVRTVAAAIRNRVAALRSVFGGNRANFSSYDAQYGRQQAFALSPTGVSGGDGMAQFGAWTDVSLSRTENSADGRAFHANTVLWQAGGDVNLNGRLVLGAGFGTETSDVDQGKQRAARDVNGYLATVYAAYMIADWLTATAFGSYGMVKNDIEVQNLLGVNVTGNSDSDRLIGGVELAAYHQAYGLNWTGSLGYTVAREKFDSYIASDNGRVNPGKTNLNTVRVGVEGAYPFSLGELYASAAVELDHIREEGGDSNGAVFGVGLRSVIFDGAYATLQASTQQFRSDEEQYELSASLRFNF